VVGGGTARSSGEYVKGSVGFDPQTGTRGVAPFGVDGLTAPAYADTGTYSRFFLIPKADRAEREPILGGLPLTEMHLSGGTGIRENRPRRNVHPTVKPLDLMRHLVRLVTPTGGTVLDPFLGSGTTAIAAEMEGFKWVGIEREAEYVAIAKARLNGTQRGLGLPA
jgi:site-specific DNA-methyltransferase (adenine-specific)